MIKEKKAPSPAWEAVHSFLTGLWMDVAEPIPDGLNSNRRPRSGSSKRDAPDLDRSQLKHLPHASITEYWKQCADAFPHLHIGRKLFSSDPQLNLPYVIVLYSFGIILLCYVRICEEQSNINWLQWKSSFLQTRCGRRTSSICYVSGSIPTIRSAHCAWSTAFWSKNLDTVWRLAVRSTQNFRNIYSANKLTGVCITRLAHDLD